MAEWLRRGLQILLSQFDSGRGLQMRIGGMDKEILKIALDTENLSFLNNHTHSTKLKNSTCGDEIKIYLIVKNKKITDFKYQGESCVYCQASASLLSRNIKNKTNKKIEFLLKQRIDSINFIVKLATWRNGYAEDCKSFYPSSILGVASKKLNL